MSSIEIPKVNKGDLVLIMKTKNDAPRLFYSDGKIARVDDLGFEGKDLDAKLREMPTPKDLRGSSVGGRPTHPEEWHYKATQIANGLIKENKLQNYLSVFGREHGDDNNWEHILRCSPGMVVGYDTTQGILDLYKPYEEKFTFGEKEYQFEMPHAKNVNLTPKGYFALPNSRVSKIIVGTPSIKHEIIGTLLDSFIDHGII